MPEAEFLAVDWGTTNRRVYVISADGDVIDTESDDRGVLAIGAGTFPFELVTIRQRFGDLPVLLAGMVGSNKGWIEVPYLPCPADLAALAAGLHWIDPRSAIVAGLSIVDGDHGDVMRGEEVQLLGAIAAGLAPADGVFCQPGTHCKWAWITAGHVGRFHTTMTGELYALLREHSLLADILGGSVVDGVAFRTGVSAAKNGTLLGDLFGVRAGTLLGLAARADAAAYVSGLMIGSDVREQQIRSGETVYVLADPSLGVLYGAALHAFGAQPVLVDSQAAFIAGITSIRRLSDGTQS